MIVGRVSRCRGGLAAARRRGSSRCCGRSSPPSPLTFPPLTGRIVDQANIIPAGHAQRRSSRSSPISKPSPASSSSSPPSTRSKARRSSPTPTQLFRAWKLGEKAKNNGVLLLVAPNERRVRIEVGYGLEGTLTDALSKVIIANAITPRFKAGDFGGGISRGVDDIITVLTTDASEWQKRPALRLDNPAGATIPVDWIVVADRHRRRRPAHRFARASAGSSSMSR